MLYPQNNACRQTWKLDGYWDFQIDQDGSGIEKEYPDGISKTRQIAVPASWNEQSNDLYHYHGIAWYQKEFYIHRLMPKQCVMLRFSSVQYHASVYVNGVLVGENDMPYLPFEFDITDAVHDGENKLVVMVNGTLKDDEPVRICDFYGFSGIARPVFISVTDKTAIEDITVKTSLSDAAGIANIFVKAIDADQASVIIDSKKFLLGEDKHGFEGIIRIEDVIPWDCENPHLYSALVELYQNDKLVDCYLLDIGFREIEVKGRQILLNGKSVYLKGFGKHEDFCIIGKGLSHALNIRDFDLLKWVGANSFRTSHYPYSEEILDLADKTGFLIISEAPFAGIDEPRFKNPITCQKALEYMRTLIERDKNHPSVISWSIGNECQTDCTAATDFFIPVINLAKEIDTRPITYVAWTKPEEDLIYSHVDIIGLNRYYGWYGYENWPDSAAPGDLTMAVQQMDDCLETFAKLYSAPLIVTEFGADTIDGMHSTFMLQFTEEFQVAFLTEYIKLIRSKSYVTGMHVWNFADFATEQSPSRVFGNRKGVFTRDRSPKLAAFALRKLWTGKDSLELYSRNQRNKPSDDSASFNVPGM